MEQLSQGNSLGKQANRILHFLLKACKYTEGNRMIVSEIPPQIPYVYLLKLSCVPGASAINMHTAMLGIWKDFMLMFCSRGICTLRLDPSKGPSSQGPGTSSPHRPQSSSWEHDPSSAAGYTSSHRLRQISSH